MATYKNYNKGNSFDLKSGLNTNISTNSLTSPTNLYGKNLLKNQSVETKSYLNSLTYQDLALNQSKQNNQNIPVNNLYSTLNQINPSNQEISDLEQEAINMLKYQKVKIQELILEIERRDKIIDSLSKRDIDNEEERIVNDNARRQVIILEDKLKLQQDSEKKQLQAFAEKLSEFQESEAKSRNLITSKDKLNHELQIKLKEKDDQLSTTKKQLLEKESTCNELKQDLNQIAVQFKSIGSKLSYKEKEFDEFKNEMTLKYEKEFKEKETYQEKLSQLVEIVKQQSIELKELDMHLSKAEASNSALNKQNSSYSEEIIKKGKELNKVEAERKHLSALLSEKTELLNFEKCQLEKMRADFDKLSRSNLENDKLLENFNNEKIELSNFVNNELNNMKQWVETYLGVFFEINYDIPDLPISYNKNFNYLRFDELKNALQNARKKLNDELSRNSNNFHNLKLELNELMEEKEKFIIEKSNMKTEIIKKQEELLELSSLNDSIQKTLILQEKNIKKMQQEFGKNDTLAFENINRALVGLVNIFKENGLFNENSYELNCSSDNEVNFSIIFENLKKLEQCVLTSISNFNLVNNQFNNKDQGVFSKYNSKINTNFMNSSTSNNINHIKNYEIEEIELRLKSKYDDLLEKELHNIEANFYEKGKFLEDKLVSMKLNLESKDRIIKDLNQEIIKISNSKSNEKGQFEFFQTKCQNLEKEFELKEVQIKNQEEMINRRNKEIEDLKQNKNDKEKEKLIKDNVALMKLNVQMSSQIKQLMEIHQKQNS